MCMHLLLPTTPNMVHRKVVSLNRSMLCFEILQIFFHFNGGKIEGMWVLFRPYFMFSNFYRLHLHNKTFIA
jgi:hypothetical protein